MFTVAKYCHTLSFLCSAFQLSSSLLDPHGPFQMLNALRTLDPQATHTVIVSFGPNAPKEVRFRLCGVKLEKEHEYQDLKNQERFLFAIHVNRRHF